MESNDPYAAVFCKGDSFGTSCGQIELTSEEYLHQLNQPNQGWSCPRCGSTADFDDTYFEDLHYRLKEDE